jgi:hypothetical protein
MKELHVISVIGLIYAVLLGLVTYIFFREYALYAVLGSAVSLFNHSTAIHAAKGELKTERLVLNIIQRYIFYMVIIVFVYFDTKDLEMRIISNSFLFLVLGFFSTKMGVFIYHMPFIKKPKQDNLEKRGEENHEISD